MLPYVVDRAIRGSYLPAISLCVVTVLGSRHKAAAPQHTYNRAHLFSWRDVQVLDISANLAEQLPGGVLEMSNLRELHAGMNRLGLHMHSLEKLEQLEVLVLASNKLLAVHPSLWNLTTLKRLDLGHNNLSELPKDVTQLTQLTVSTHACCLHSNSDQGFVVSGQQATWLGFCP